MTVHSRHKCTADVELGWIPVLTTMVVADKIWAHAPASTTICNPTKNNANHLPWLSCGQRIVDQLEWVHLYWFYWFAVWNFFRIWQFYVPKGRYKYFAMISMWWGLVILYSRYHIILLPQCWWRLVILLSCYRIILPSLTTLSYRLRTGCHCSILPSLVNIALGSKARKTVNGGSLFLPFVFFIMSLPVVSCHTRH